MSIESKPYYWVVCDGCGARDDQDDFSAWSEPGDAVERATCDGEWITWQDSKHYCAACFHWCPKCESEQIPDTLPACVNCADSEAVEQLDADAVFTELVQLGQDIERGSPPAGAPDAPNPDPDSHAPDGAGG